MEINPEVSYIVIPNEVSIMFSIDVNSNDARCIVDADDNITCVVIVGDTEMTSSVLSKALEIKGDKPLKIAWFSNRKSIPFLGEKFQYLKLGDELYMNISNDNNIRFAEITKSIETLDSLNPLDMFYFEKFEELKKKDK